ncbi:MAG: TIGR03943 family protein [Microbacterium sp.]|nr:MAG: TIGR03943 family protein [Microbacterium sp.]
MPDVAPRRTLGRLSTRILGVGLAAALAAVTIALALTDRLALYINPSSNPFAIAMAVVVLVGAVASFALPLGAEADHGHDHGHAPDDAHSHAHAHDERAAVPSASRGSALAATAAVTTGGVLATGIVAAIVLVPPASLSVQLAMSRDTGSAPLFQGADRVSLAATGDTASFGVGDWASVFATATNPEAFAGDEVTLTGFVTPARTDDDATAGDGFALTRLVITHCVIDAQPASVPIAVAAPDGDRWETGQWVTIDGVIRDVDGDLRIEAQSIAAIDEPRDPYEY